MEPDEFQDVSSNFALLCAQLQAMFKVAAKRERKRYTVTQEVNIIFQMICILFLTKGY